MIPINGLIDKLNTLIASGTLTDLELAQAFGAIDSIEKTGIGAVSTSLNLPPAADNKGRFIYITNEYKFVFSNGISWDISSIIRKPDVNLYGWGSNSGGQLGDNTSVSKSSPVSVIGGFTDWTSITSGRYHSIGLRSNGTAWGWGGNSYGRIGDGVSGGTRLSPVSVVGGFTDWVQLSLNTYHSLGVRANGTAWGWGINNLGHLGDATVTSRSSPVSVVGGFTDWTQVSAGTSHSIGLRGNGTIWAWGYNLQGQLGDGTTTSKTSPVSIIGGFTDWIQTSSGRRHNIALRANGTAWGWGHNINGVLGDGTNVNKSSPVSVVGGFTDWIQISAGFYHNLGIRANGTAWAWGSNGSGRLGDNTTTVRSSPVSVVGGFTDWTQVSAGYLHSVGLRANGTIWSWGSNANGRLGDGTTTSRSSPGSIVGGFTDWVDISQGPWALQSFGIKS